MPHMKSYTRFRCAEVFPVSSSLSFRVMEVAAQGTVAMQGVALVSCLTPESQLCMTGARG